MKRVVLVFASIFMPAVAYAGTSGGLSVGTLGYGLEVSSSASGAFGFRGGINAYNRKFSATEDNIDYDLKLKLQTVSLLGDWYPFMNNFRLSAGLMHDGNKLTLTGKPTGSSYTINNTTYTASQVGSLTAQVDFNSLAPYFGIGYGRPVGKGLSFIADLGVIYQGSPKSNLSVTCGAGIPAATCTQLQSDAAAEQARLDDSLRHYKYYPVLAVGLAYTF